MNLDSLFERLEMLAVGDCEPALPGLKLIRNTLVEMSASPDIAPSPYSPEVETMVFVLLDTRKSHLNGYGKKNLLPLYLARLFLYGQGYGFVWQMFVSSCHALTLQAVHHV